MSGVPVVEGWLSAEGLAALILVVGRLGGLLLIAPMFSARAVPMRIRTLLLVFLTLILYPIAGPAGELTVGAFLLETLVGFAVGLGAAIFVAAAAGAGDLLAIQMGLAGANVLNPLTNDSLPTLGQFVQLSALTLVLAADGHLLMLDALRESLLIHPLGGPLDAEAGLIALVGSGARLFLLGLQFASPVVAALLLGNVALGILGRAVPQLNLLMIAFPVQIGLGLIGLAAAIPVIGAVFTRWPTDFAEVTTRLLGAFSAGGGS